MATSERLILLADDEPHDIELTLRALRACEIRADVDVVNDGQEALDYLYRRGAFAERSAREPSLILLDIKMPRLTGLEVVQTLKADPDMRHIPVVMLTSSREPSDLDDSYASGTNAYVVKPVGYTSYVDAVMRIDAFWTRLNQLPSR